MAPSSRHSKVEPGSLELKETSGVATFDGSPGVPSSVVAGGVRSTVTVTTSPAVWPVRSTATARSARSPSAGSGQSALQGADVAVPSAFHAPVAQPALASLQAKKSTWSMPLPLSAAVAVIVRGSGEASLTYEPAAGEEIETVGGWLSTRTPITSADVVAFPARSVARARRSYSPSVSAVVSQSGGVAVQSFAPAGEYSYVTDATPEPSPSSRSAPRVTTPVTLAPGSWSVTVGGVSSTRTFARTSETVVLLATSVATARTS